MLDVPSPAKIREFVACEGRQDKGRRKNRVKCVIYSDIVPISKAYVDTIIAILFDFLGDLNQLVCMSRSPDRRRPRT